MAKNEKTSKRVASKAALELLASIDRQIAGIHFEMGRLQTVCDRVVATLEAAKSVVASALTQAADRDEEG